MGMNEAEDTSSLEVGSLEADSTETGTFETVASENGAEVESEQSVVATPQNLVEVIGALFFASADPIGLDLLQSCSGASIEEIEEAIVTLKSSLLEAGLGLELIAVGEKYQLRTKAELGPFLRKLKAGTPRRLSAAALETLAIVAYRQPVVRSEMERIRGVDVTPTLKTLVDRGLVRVVGHAASVGQPALFGTTEEFLKIFGLRDLTELPTLRDLAELDRDPGEEGEVENDDSMIGLPDTDSSEEEAAITSSAITSV